MTSVCSLRTIRNVAIILMVGWMTLCVAMPTSFAQQFPSANSPSADQDCACRNIPGGYPCVSGCPKCMMGVDCQNQCGEELRWRDMCPMAFGAYGPGGYAGPARLSHLSVYRLRPGDQFQVFYLITRRQEEGSYRLTPGDEVMIESIADEELSRGTLERGLGVQPDGSISLRLLGQVHAAGLSASQLRKVLNTMYKKYYDDPQIDVTPVKFNTLADDVRNAVGGASGLQQQALNVTVMPDGKIRLPVIGSVCVQGLSFEEMKKEVNLRYEEEAVVGLEIEPRQLQLADRFATVMGQVATPGRIQMTGPTSVLMAIGASGGQLPGGNMRQVVVLRRAEDWRLISTMLDLQGAVFGKRPTPTDEIWLRDGDVVIVPDKPIQRVNNVVEQIFTNGIYRVAPINFDVSQ